MRRKLFRKRGTPGADRLRFNELCRFAQTVGACCGMTVSAEQIGPAVACLVLEGELLVVTEREEKMILQELLAQASQVDVMSSGDRVRLCFFYDLPPAG